MTNLIPNPLFVLVPFVMIFNLISHKDIVSVSQQFCWQKGRTSWEKTEPIRYSHTKVRRFDGSGFWPLALLLTPPQRLQASESCCWICWPPAGILHLNKTPPVSTSAAEATRESWRSHDVGGRIPDDLHDLQSDVWWRMTSSAPPKLHLLCQVKDSCSKLITL